MLWRLLVTELITECVDRNYAHTPYTEILLHSNFFPLFFKLALSLERHVSEYKQELEIYQSGFAGGEFGEFISLSKMNQTG